MNEIVMLWYYRVFQFKLYLWQINVKFITEVLKLQETNRNTAGASQVVHLSRFSTLGSKARIWHSWHRTLLRLPGSVCTHEFHNSICIHKIQQILFPIFSDWKKTLKLQNTCGFADWPVTVSWIILKHLNIVIYLIGPTFAISAQNLSAQIPLIENFTNSEHWGFVFTC